MSGIELISLILGLGHTLGVVTLTNSSRYMMLMMNIVIILGHYQEWKNYLLKISPNIWLKLFYYETIDNNYIMSKSSPFAVESRDQITKNAINKSTSKVLWSFSKDRRFSMNKPPCPYVSYLNNLSTINNRKTVFGSAKRRVFTEVSDVPSSDTYTPSKEKQGNIPIFALSREVILWRCRTVSLAHIIIITLNK